ncbi:MAG: hypothetical protein WC205_04355 [Opitutaceae bacterium]
MFDYEGGFTGIVQVGQQGGCPELNHRRMVGCVTGWVEPMMSPVNLGCSPMAMNSLAQAVACKPVAWVSTFVSSVMSCSISAGPLGCGQMHGQFHGQEDECGGNPPKKTDKHTGSGGCSNAFSREEVAQARIL